jgi:hypothetical protein
MIVTDAAMQIDCRDRQSRNAADPRISTDEGDSKTTVVSDRQASKLADRPELSGITAPSKSTMAINPGVPGPGP